MSTTRLRCRISSDPQVSGARIRPFRKLAFVASPERACLQRRHRDSKRGASRQGVAPPGYAVVSLATCSAAAPLHPGRQSCEASNDGLTDLLRRLRQSERRSRAVSLVDERVLIGTGKPRPAALARYLRVAADAQHPDSSVGQGLQLSSADSARAGPGAIGVAHAGTLDAGSCALGSSRSSSPRAVRT